LSRLHGEKFRKRVVILSRADGEGPHNGKFDQAIEEMHADLA
jgi:hypothetical protein